MGGLPLEFIIVQPPKGGPSLEVINILPPKGSPALEFIITQPPKTGSTSRIHPPQGTISINLAVSENLDVIGVATGVTFLGFNEDYHKTIIVHSIETQHLTSVRGKNCPTTFVHLTAIKVKGFVCPLFRSFKTPFAERFARARSP